MIAAPARCPVCSEEALEAIGAGTERVEEDFKELFRSGGRRPGRDTARRPGGLAALLERFGRGEIQVLIGTRWSPRDIHFPQRGADRRARRGRLSRFSRLPGRRAHLQLLTQVAGRAGRESVRAGSSSRPTIRALRHPGRSAAGRRGLCSRRDALPRVFHYPPYSRMVQLLVRDKNRERRKPSSPPRRRARGASPGPRRSPLAGPRPPRAPPRPVALPASRPLRQLPRPSPPARDGPGRRIPLRLVIDVESAAASVGTQKKPAPPPSKG